MNTQQTLELPASPPSNTVVINARCTLRTEEDQRVILVAGLPVYHFCAADAAAEAYAMVMLVESGFAQQTGVARAFGKSDRTIRRHQERYEQIGMMGLGRPEGWRRGRRRISGRRLRLIERLKSQGLSNRAIAQRLGVSEMAIRKLVGPSKCKEVRQFALVPASGASSRELPQIQPSSASGVVTRADHRQPTNDVAKLQEHAEEHEPVPMSLDHDAGDRTFDRQMAYLGLLDDAAPILRDGAQVPGVGVLLAVPYPVHSGLLQIARKLYGEIGPAFYGLRTTLVTLFLMALLRIQRPEQLKERLLGLDRAPEVKTLRRQLSRLAAHHHAEQLGAELARARVAQRGELMGFLYVDGHIRAYHGRRTIPSADVARRHLAMPATTDYWINDRYLQIITRAHEHGIKLIGATILPFEGVMYYSAEKEVIRTTINQWIRTSKKIDGVVDFDAAVRDPANPGKLKAEYDSSDHLHPNAEGHRRMGEVVDLTLFR